MKLLSILFAFFAFTAFAADVSGTWKGTAEIQGNTIERTFVFKVAAPNSLAKPPAR